MAVRAVEVSLHDEGVGKCRDGAEATDSVFLVLDDAQATGT